MDTSQRHLYNSRVKWNELVIDRQTLVGLTRRLLSLLRAVIESHGIYNLHQHLEPPSSSCSL